VNSNGITHEINKHVTINIVIPLPTLLGAITLVYLARRRAPRWLVETRDRMVDYNTRSGYAEKRQEGDIQE
jgi:hypothetical protein